MDKKQWARTQGKYNPQGSKRYNNGDESKGVFKSDQKPHNGKRYSNRKTFKNNKMNSHSDIKDEVDLKPRVNKNNTSLVYQETANDEDSMLTEPKNPPEAEIIRNPGTRVLGETENGKSYIYYEPDFMDLSSAGHLLKNLADEIEWSDKNIVIRGQEYPQPRLVAWFGPLSYKYSGVKLEAKEIPPQILQVKRDIEKTLREQAKMNVTFNSVLLNLYRNGKDSVAWHSDDESLMGIHPTIASISLGETRRFEIRKKPPHPSSTNPADFVVHLTHGSLIVMDGAMQQDWQHRVPKEYHDKKKRINLTFRTVYALEKIPYSQLPQQNYVSTPQPKEQPKPFEMQKEDFPTLGNPELDSNKLSQWCDMVEAEENKTNENVENKLNKHDNPHIDHEALSSCKSMEDSLSEVQNMDTSSEALIPTVISTNSTEIPSDEIWSDVDQIKCFVPKTKDRPDSKPTSSHNSNTNSRKNHYKKVQRNTDNEHVDAEVPGMCTDTQYIIERMEKNYDYVAKYWEEDFFRKYEKDELEVLMTVIESSKDLPIHVISVVSDRIGLLIENAERRYCSKTSFHNTRVYSKSPSKYPFKYHYK